MKNILLPTDFSELSRVAYPTAASVAKDRGARIHLVYQAESLPPFYYESISQDFPLEGYYDGFRKQLAAEAAHPDLAGLEPITHLLYPGGDHPEILEFAQSEGIDLIVLCSHGRGAQGVFFLGSFAERLIRHSPVPVYTCHRNPTPFPPRSVVVPFDFSDNAKAVLPIVRGLSQLYQPKFTFLFVLSEPKFLEFDEYPSGNFAEALQQATDRSLRKARSEFESLQPDAIPKTNVDFATREGKAYSEILKVARDVQPDLIVMSTHGRTGSKRFFLGSVTERVLRRAPCSVLTVRPQLVGSDGKAQAANLESLLC